MKNYNRWNVALWISNTEHWYKTANELVMKARRCCRNKYIKYTLDDAARDLLSILPERTLDGVKLTFTTVRNALVGWS
jgi:hypothetical protein